MRMGYIVTAHHLPDQLVRLVRCLDSPNARFFVHVDARAPDSVMATVQRELGDAPNVRLLPRHRCVWASFSLVEATLEGVSAILASDEPIDYGVLLTGQDYPLHGPETIERKLADANGRSFLSHWPSAGRFLDRVERWHWHGSILGRRVRLPNRFAPLSIRRTLPTGLRPFTGSAHWCLSRGCLEAIGDTMVNRPDVVEFFRRTAVPDESFFQTILLSSPLADTIVNDDLRYIDWSGGDDSPRVLTMSDLDRLLSSDDLFARKFDPRVDAAVLDSLDARILEEQAGSVR